MPCACLINNPQAKLLLELSSIECIVILIMNHIIELVLKTPEKKHENEKLYVLFIDIIFQIVIPSFNFQYYHGGDQIFF
jgi:hypothetical protein